MRGFVTDPAGQAGLRLADDLPEPEPAAGEFLLEVRGYAINPGEVGLIARRPNGWRPGQDVTGVVLRAAADGSGPPVGSRVAAVVDWESWAERVAVPSGWAAVLDDRVSFAQAAAIPCAGLAALRTLRYGGAVLGRDVLVTGATGGTGQFSVQLAVLSGARVTALVSGPQRVDLARELGAHRVLTSLEDDTVGRFDLVLDGVAGPTVAQAARRLKPEGTLVVYGGGTGSTVEPRDLYLNGVANGRLILGFIGILPHETKGEDIAIVADLVAEGRVRPLIGWQEDWTRTPDAFDALAKRAIRGRAVLLREP
ncbi:zinc-binding dehydrogenase [Pseudofrankia inefficax]|uniref:Alcohol dehydrogenase zinc-binding domain protein n=1 Tax=Pseudofrankia inefficax (strain DSM 45817 / CECT 9037 / DDB 130130 / EuI1c) TaxID=298654 RepID=E3J3R2_PSEI1|nr:zinc-binding dehydrogenase [Pseudofrankia inefficax]ADP79399.1 Alcohol dehydrogenase zinc-binding domain protein [Pseudofrankia inefficax]